MKNLIFLFITTTFFCLLSCEKEEGEGGTSTITGKIYVLNYNTDYTQIESEYYAQEEDVYIVYGDDNIYSDRFRTHYDGSYRFQYLRKGDYTIYAYSKDTTGISPSGYIPVSKTIEISKTQQEVEVEDIVIIK